MSEEMSVYERALAKEKAISQRKRPSHVESNEQIACVEWFAYAYPAYSQLLFAVPNGGRRDKRTGAILKAEGVKAGVSDLMLLVPRGDYHGLCIELKKKGGRQSESQKEFEKAVGEMGYLYKVCYEFEDFANIIYLYMSWPGKRK